MVRVDVRCDGAQDVSCEGDLAFVAVSGESGTDSSIMGTSCNRGDLLCVFVSLLVSLDRAFKHIRETKGKRMSTTVDMVAMSLEFERFCECLGSEEPYVPLIIKKKQKEAQTGKYPLVETIVENGASLLPENRQCPDGRA